MEYLQTSEPAQEEAPSPPEIQPSVIKRIFRNRFGHWRAGWRILVYAIAVFVIGKAISTHPPLRSPGA